MNAHTHDRHDNIEILYQNKYGYILRCRHCSLYHLAFGNIALDQNKQDLIDLVFLIDQYQAHAQQVRSECQRCVFVDTPFNGFRFVFSRKELALFHEMLQKTYLIIQAEDIINN